MTKLRQYFAKIKEFVNDLYNKNKKLFFMSLALIVVIFGALIWTVFGSASESKKLNKGDIGVAIESYADGVERKIETMLLSMKKVSVAKVFVMVDSSPVKNYLTEK